MKAEVRLDPRRMPVFPWQWRFAGLRVDAPSVSGKRSVQVLLMTNDAALWNGLLVKLRLGHQDVDGNITGCLQFCPGCMTGRRCPACRSRYYAVDDFTGIFTPMGGGRCADAACAGGFPSWRDTKALAHPRWSLRQVSLGTFMKAAVLAVRDAFPGQ